MMPSIKRQASDSFSGPNQSLVKRQKSSSDLNEAGKSTTSGKDGALVQSVSYLVFDFLRRPRLRKSNEGRLIMIIDRYHELQASKHQLWS